MPGFVQASVFQVLEEAGYELGRRNIIHRPQARHHAAGARLERDTGQPQGGSFIALGGIVPLDETLLVFVTEKTAGFVAGNATKSFILGETVSLLTKSTITRLLDEDDVITWELSGNNLGTDAQRTGLAPLTNISAELFYNPYTHYTTALIGATCNLPGSTKTAIYIPRYEVTKTAFGSAEMVDGTLTVAVRQLQ